MTQQQTPKTQQEIKQETGYISRWRRIYTSRPDINFRKIWPKTFITSGALMLGFGLLLLSGLYLNFRSLNLGIEFEGGTVWELRSSKTSVSQLRDSIAPQGHADARIQSLSDNTYRIRVGIKASQSNSQQISNSAQINQITTSLAQAANIPKEDVNFTSVSSSWGKEIANKTKIAVLIFIGVLAFYMWVRLEWRMTVAALVAVGHDILFAVGIYALFALEITPATLIAFLTILGYSLYDTLVVFDKIRENENRRENIPYQDLVSRSMNQVLVRSVNTTITSVVPVAVLLFVGSFILGAVTLSEFAIALLIGLIAGTYSSIFVATPLVAWLKKDSHKSTENSKKEDKPDITTEPVKNIRKGMLAESKVVSKPQAIPRPRKKKRR